MQTSSWSLWVFIGVLLVVVSVPLLLGWVKPNPWYGFRTYDTLNDPDIWYKVNAYCARWLLIVGVVLALVALILGPIAGMNRVLYGLVCTFIMLAGVLGTILASWRCMRSLVQE